MYFYEVLVASQKFHGNKSLTYSFDSPLKAGNVVVVELRSNKVLGIIKAKVAKPDFEARPIIRVIEAEPLASEQLQLIEWLQTYYPSPLGGLIQAFLPSSLLQSARLKKSKSLKVQTKPILLPKLTEEQINAFNTISRSKHTSHLLYGETGSGKTRVYAELAKRLLAAGRSCIVLTPEIGLVPQLSKTMAESTGTETIVLHSGLTPAERRTAWLRIANAKSPLVVVGTRSALLAPIKNIGLIVLDESHDSAYKQEQTPYYQASRLAAKLAELHNAKLVMGTATPSLSDYFVLEQKNAPIVRMKRLAMGDVHKPDVSVVRLGQRDEFGKSPYLSSKLLTSIKQALAAKEQSLVFLNRRGTARVVLCKNCGWQALCPNCDINLTYHGDKHAMRCHSCGFQSTAPSSCPKCKHPDVSFRSIGTKYLVDELSRLFPDAKIQRFDTDSTKSERLEQNYAELHAGKVDILVGTQLLSKGLDLPRLSIIGIVLADTGLLIPDFTSNEITYQQIAQIIGRVGRGHRKGKVVVQTYQPDNPAIQAALKRDYKLFYDQELEERRLFRFPPFRFMLKLECTRASRQGAEGSAKKLADEIRSKFSRVEVIGPGPAFHEKIGNKYRWQVVVKSTDRNRLLDVVASLPANWAYDLDPANLL